MQGVLAGRYRLERQLGKGGMGSVWLAEHLALRSWVAVKLMDPAIAATPEGAERFRREAQAAASLRSAHVVQVLDYGVDGATPFLVMELMQGESLAGCLEREQRLTPVRTAAIMTQVARALGRAHAAGIVHRDLKPDNIFLVREDDQELVKILDFGIAKTPQAQFGGMETRTGVTMGTPYYMSPEQVEGKKAVDFRTDLWAMAVIACECMSGLRPFDGSTFGELLLNICARPIPVPSDQGLHLPGFDAWFAKATNRDPEQRFASAQELASTLKEIADRAAGPAGFPAPLPARTASMPAPAPRADASSQIDAATAVTGASLTASSVVQGAAPSSSSITAQGLAGAPRRPGAGALPWILLALALLMGAVLVALLLRPRPNESGVEASASSSPVSSGPPSNREGLARDSATTEPGERVDPSNAHELSGTSRTTVPHRASAAAPHPSTSTSVGGSAPETQGAPVAAAPSAPTTGAVPTVTTRATAAASVGPTSRCFSDPFSGQVRPLTAGRAPDAPTFACRRDPFTGRYKKL